MGNSGSSPGNGTCKSCNSCSEKGLYFAFGKKTDAKLYAVIKGKERRVYMDSKGRYYKEGSVRRTLPKGTRTFKKDSPKRRVKAPKRKTTPIRKKERSGPRKVTKGYYLRKKIKSPTTKVVKDKRNRNIGRRLSARAVFNELGMKAVGRSFSVLQKDGTHKMKVLRIRQNGSPYFANNFGNRFGNRHLMHNNRTFGNHIKECQRNGLTHLDIPFNKDWLRGSYVDNMTGLKYSWPNELLPPAGVAQPREMSILPRVAGRSHFGA